MKNVTKKQAETLKVLGYNRHTTVYYLTNKEGVFQTSWAANFNEPALNACSAPTYEEVFEWLRERGVYVWVSAEHSPVGVMFSGNAVLEHNGAVKRFSRDLFPDYYDAQSFILELVLGHMTTTREENHSESLDRWEG